MGPEGDRTTAESIIASKSAQTKEGISSVEAFCCNNGFLNHPEIHVTASPVLYGVKVSQRIN
jgi:hypothetical protein